MSVNLRMFLAVGFCGGFTTFSTFMNENVGLIKADASFSMLIYLAGSLVGGFLMVLAGYALMKILYSFLFVYMKTLFSLFTLFFLPFAICWGEVIPAPLIADSMVLQQKSKVRLWGTARSQTRVTARCSWLQREIVCQSDAGGRWEMQVETPACRCRGSVF